MNYVYTDGTRNDDNRGAYCVVAVEPGETPTWEVFGHDAEQINEIELAGIVRAVQIARDLHKKNGHKVHIFCDSLSAITNAQDILRGKQPAWLQFRHIKGHSLYNGISDEHTKRHHWCDVMAANYLNTSLIK